MEHKTPINEFFEFLIPPFINFSNNFSELKSKYANHV